MTDGDSAGRQPEGEFAGAYGVEVLLDATPSLDDAAVFAALQSRFAGQVDRMSPPGETDFLLFAFPAYPSYYQGATALPAQLFVAASPRPEAAERLAPSLEQTWDWPGARDTVRRCQATLLVTDMMASGLEPRPRLECFHKALSAVLDATPSALAIHWIRSQILVDPRAYHAVRQDPAASLLHGGPLNVRLFNVADRGPSEYIMDTRGLTAFGLPDVQCHFGGLDRDEIARLLYNVGAYLFEQGDVIADGDTVPGVHPGQTWTCRHEHALAPPRREVLDIDPGPLYNALG